MNKYKFGLIDICLILTIIFVILKLTGLITWSLLWVFSPLWIIPAFILGIITVLILLSLLGLLITIPFLPIILIIIILKEKNE